MGSTYTINYSGKTLNGTLVTGTSYESATSDIDAKTRAEKRVNALYPDMEQGTLKVYVMHKEEEEDEPYF